MVRNPSGVPVGRRKCLGHEAPENPSVLKRRIVWDRPDAEGLTYGEKPPLGRCLFGMVYILGTFTLKSRPGASMQNCLLVRR